MLAKFMASETEDLTPISHAFDKIEQGKNILVSFNNLLSVIKFVGYWEYKREAGLSRVTRNCSVPSANRTLPDGRKVEEVVTSVIYGQCRLDFRYDPEFELYLPQSHSQDMILELVFHLQDGSVYNYPDFPKICSDQPEVAEKIRMVTRPGYYENVVAPFLESQPTHYEMPTWKKSFFRKTNMIKLHARYEKATENLEHGSFVYVGCKEEVYLLCVAKNDDGSLYMQGTYTPSTKPVFYFSNNYLDFMSRFEAEKPKFHGKDGDLCNVAVYRTEDPAGFCGKPFIYPELGRSQDVKNSIFTGEPDIITGDLAEALAHFQTTDFAEFADIVEKYAKTPELIHPFFERRYRYFI